MEKDEVWMDENRKRSRKRLRCLARRGDDEARAECLYTYRNNTRCLTRRGGGDGSAVARLGDDEARADSLAVTVQQSRGAAMTRRVPIACILTVTTRGVCAVAVTGER
ncbi:hypothetical protein J6590_047323 [Homalodisca vitripennis]|nr:hypothetical protein J6590_047323 [Homalodisca vitripennis]